MIICYSLLKEVIVDIKMNHHIDMESNYMKNEGNNDHNVKSESELII